MKRLTTMALGLSLLLGSAAFTFADEKTATDTKSGDAKQTATKKHHKHKKGEKKATTNSAATPAAPTK